MAPPDAWESDVQWWLDVVADDPIYQSDVLPLLRGLVTAPAGPWLDVGCGDGRAVPALPEPVIGCDLAVDLLTRAAQRVAAVRCRLPDLSWLRPGVLSGASVVLVLEHLEDLQATLAALLRAVRPGGELVVVANHPAFTAPGAGPIVDTSDGEVLWRWGPYFDPQPATTVFRGRDVGFHHRPLGVLLTIAADTGWCLELMDERALSGEAVAHEPGYFGQEHLPRLAGFRWRRPA